MPEKIPPFCLGKVTIGISPDGRKIARRTSCSREACQYFVPPGGKAPTEIVETPFVVTEEKRQKIETASADSLLEWCAHEQAKNAQNN